MDPTAVLVVALKSLLTGWQVLALLLCWGSNFSHISISLEKLLLMSSPSCWMIYQSLLWFDNFVAYQTFMKTPPAKSQVRILILIFFCSGSIRSASSSLPFSNPSWISCESLSGARRLIGNCFFRTTGQLCLVHLGWLGLMLAYLLLMNWCLWHLLDCCVLSCAQDSWDLTVYLCDL